MSDEKKSSISKPNSHLETPAPGDSVASEPTTQRSHDDDEYPEGGYRAWLTVFGAFWIQFCGFGYSTSYGVFQDFYTRVYITNESSSPISWIGGLNCFLVDSSGLLFGRLYDQGYFRHLIYGGSLLSTFSLFMLSLSKPNHLYQNFLSQGLGEGIGAGMMFVPSIAVVSHYFKKRRAAAMSIVSAGSSLGAVLHPLMLNNTLNDSVGFATATRANAALMSGLLIIACLTMRPRLPPPGSSPSLKKSLIKFYHDRAYVLASVGIMFFIAGYYFPIFFLQLYAIKHGQSKNFAFYLLVMMNGSSFVARLVAGFLSQKLGVINMLIFSSGSCAIMIFVIPRIVNNIGFIIFAIIYGATAGVFVTLMAPAVAVLTNDISELGARMGITFFFCGLGALIGAAFPLGFLDHHLTNHLGPTIDGALLSTDFIWWKPIVFSGCLGLCSFACFLAIPLITHKKIVQSCKSLYCHLQIKDIL